MIESKLFRDVLSVAYQIGAEKVANNEGNPTRKPHFGFGIYGELKQEIEAKGIDVAALSENEKSAIIFAFCSGWNAEVNTRY